MGDEHIDIIQDPIYGYRRLDPIPSGDDVARFYESQYYDLIRIGGRAPDIRRLMAGGSEAEREREWITATLFTDIAYCIDHYAPGNRVLDIGCGTGELISFLSRKGFDPGGIEPAAEAVEIAKSLGLTVSQATLEEYARSSDKEFDAITFLDVLEHIPDPVDAIRKAQGLLAKAGCLCIRAPNDFSELQLAAHQKIGGDPWWVAIPDHINYFNFQSMENLLSNMGFEVVYTQGDFPMELFLLMGDEYVDDPEIGRVSQWKRVLFEMSIPDDLRRRIYHSLSKQGVGRHLLIVAEKVRSK